MSDHSKKRRPCNSAQATVYGRAGFGLCSSASLVREAEVHHVAVLDHVLLALEPHLSGVLRARLALERDVVVIRDGLGADEALLEVGVDDARGLRRLGAARDGPGA